MQEVKKVTTEVGTNEWQLVVFVLGEQSFAINVDKTREILRWPGCRAIPDAPVALIGITSVRGEVLPMVDLRVFLGIPPVAPLEQSKVIIAEFNEVKLGFVVDAVERIYRIKSEDLDASMTGKYLGDWILYVIKRDTRNVLLLDYEAIVQTISPQLVIQHTADTTKAVAMMEGVGHPADYHIIVAEDSPLIRKQIEDALIASGFTNLRICADGKAAFDAIVHEGEHCDLLITDVEMPRLDGLTLTRRIKENVETKNIPVIVFSSIMANDIKNKAASVGANYQVTKPEINLLVEYVVRVIRERQEREKEAE
ncbi:MAG: chemotaxis protein CheV [Synergistaceae bacterium]|nr:chemotaxis protein CheV [Synergistaceae bacterium]MBQ3625393.1 chemotaxis protein CheV [Synergistaceae bacterium]MBQ6739484.1 chemotaxis protein CheV [Synergistaceae bacterium]MBQ9896645.1 chemotaxis protein CheV [Synergistaceae bacterium]MBR0043585.1 chemotaxis protein CheV [Synergistaceae bacterium]